MRKAVLILLIFAMIFAAAGMAADSFTLTKVAETNNTITFSYPQQNGYGYLYSANGVVVSRTNDPTRTQVKFAKASSYEVATASKGTTGSYPPSTPPPPSPACSDGIDNDNPADGKIDYPADPGCTSATDTDETDVVSPPPSTISSAECGARASIAGAVIANVTVNGGCTVQAPSVTIQDSVLSDEVEFQPGASGGKLFRSKALGFNIFGADNILLENNTFDGRGIDNQNLIWDQPAGNVPSGWIIRGNLFTRYYIDDGVTHSEALYVGYSSNGLIENNSFVDNGNTSHIFFTWFGNTANPSTSYPRNICVRGNTFGPTHGAFFDVNLREEIPVSSGIKVQNDASITNMAFYGIC